MASNALAAGDGFGFLPPTEKSLMLFIATAGSEPLRMRGSDGPSAIARKGEVWGAFGSECSERLSHPSSVAFRPGVPVSMKSCASKCERVRDNDVQAIGSATLEDHDEALGPRGGLGCSECGACEKARDSRCADYGESAVAKKYATSWHEKLLGDEQ